MVDVRAIALQLATDQITSSLWIAPSLAFWGLISGAVGLVVIAGLLKKFRQLFYVYRFEHADNH